MGIIAGESSNFGSSDNTSRWLYPIMYFLAPQFTLRHFAITHSVLRKAGHFVGYAMLSLLMFGAWWATMNPPRLRTRLWSEIRRCWDWRAALLALLSAVTVASLDEWHQLSLPSRTGAFHDVLLDSAAAICVQAFVIAFAAPRLYRTRES